MVYYQDSKDEWGAILRFWNSLKHDDESTLVIFEQQDRNTTRNQRRGENDDIKNVYTAFGICADWFAAHTMDGNTLLKNTTSNGKVVNYSKILPQALREASESKRIKIYTKNNSGNWVVSKESSPGNRSAIEDILEIGSDKDQVTMAIRPGVKNGEKRVGICYVNLSTKEIGMCEFDDDQFNTNLLAFTIQLGASEALIPPIGEDDKKNIQVDQIVKSLSDVDDQLAILLSQVPASDFNDASIEEDMPKILIDGDVSLKGLPQFDDKLARQAAAALIKYLSFVSNEEYHGYFSVVPLGLQTYMRLDPAALRALNLFPGPMDGAKTMSLYGFLDQCKTSGGKRLLSRWLRQPLIDIAEINQRHELVQLLVDNGILCDQIRNEYLSKVPDLSKLQRKLARGSSKDPLGDLICIYQLVIELPGLLEVLRDTDSELLKVSYADEIEELAQDLQMFENLINETIDLEHSGYHDYRIKADFDENLQLLSQKMAEIDEEFKAIVTQVQDDLGVDDKILKFEHHKVEGWCFRITRTNIHYLKGKSHYILYNVRKDGQPFTTKRVKALDATYKELQNKYYQVQSQLCKKIVSIAATYATVLERLAMVLSHLDVIASFAYVASHSLFEYVRPKMNPIGEGNTVLKESRHPCMEVQDGLQFIPNDVNLKRGESEFLVITGPNMGGKSTFIRQIGVIALMAQVGSFVPCTEAELTVYDSIHARVGAGDSQLKGVSTFMAEMLEVARILQGASANSLIIIDELGRGTSTFDGFGIAWAIAEHIVTKIKAMGMFATHFHELTSLADTHPQVQNLHVLAHVGESTSASSGPSKTDDEEIVLQYKVEPGVSSQSFGIHVAELVKFPEKVVRMAKRKARELEDFEGELDEVVSEKIHKRFSNEEVQEGNALLRRILLEWRKGVNTTKDSEDEILTKLRDIVGRDDNRAKLELSGYIQELMSVL